MNLTKRFSVALLLGVSLVTGSVQIASAEIIADHQASVQFDQIPSAYITQAINQFRIFYGHTSHGSQIITGMNALETLNSFYGLTGNDPVSGDISIQEYSSDLGYSTWDATTDSVLASSTNNRNMILWSWCGQVSSASESTIAEYLAKMEALELRYPNVTFIYMTGHLDGGGSTGNLNVRNNQIRDYVRQHNKILFDFADIESYNPSGSEFMTRAANDGNYYNGGNWSTEWWGSADAATRANYPYATQTSNSVNGGCAHSTALNCDLKARAFWWLMARVAGWPGVGGTANNPPTVATAASASPSTVTGTSTILSVLGADDGGEAALTYTWATTGTPPAAVTFSTNGTNAAKNTTATFTRAGSYNLQATIRDAGGLTVTSPVSIPVTVSAILTSITVSPSNATVAVNTTQAFTATASDQFNRSLVPQPSLTWTVSGGGSINSSGLFTAGSTASSPNTVTAASGGRSGTAQLTVSLNRPPTIQLISPAVGGTHTAPATVLWQVRVTSGTAALSRVQFLNGSTVLTTFNNPSSGLLNYTWSSVPSGSYALSAVVTDTQSLTNMANGSITVNPTPVSPLPDPDLSGLDGKTFRVNDTLSFTYNGTATGFNWTIDTLAASTLQRRASLANASVPTTSPQLCLLDLNLTPGSYLLTVQALNGSQLSNTASARITLNASDLDTFRVYPNPWRSNKHKGHPVTFDTLPTNSTVKLYTLSGHWIKTLAISTTSAEWNLDNDTGDKVASGIYLYVITNDQGQRVRGKVVIIR
jgi:hypothetical protein